MKKVLLSIAIVVAAASMASCGNKTVKGGDKDSAVVSDSLNANDSISYNQEMEAAKVFVEKFYEGWGVDDLLEYDKLKPFITSNLLKYLADSYDYDCEGECLATWKFFYEGGGDVGEMESRQISARDEKHVLVENKYVNYEYDVLLTVIKDGDNFKIDSLQQKRSEYTN